MSKLPLTQDRRQLTYAGAMVAIAAAIAKSRELGAPECIAVVDGAGHLLAYARVEGAAVLALKPSIAKAKTAAALGGPSGGIPFEFGVNLATASDGGIANLGGGLPIVLDGQVLGAIGVGSGTTEQDVAVATAGQTALVAALRSA